MATTVETVSATTHPITQIPLPHFANASGLDIRLASRAGTLSTPTTGLATGYLQANLIVLPTIYAADFRAFCKRNPVPCPLLAESAAPGDFRTLISHVPGFSGSQIAGDIDLRRDAPRFTVYRDGVEDASAKGSGNVEKCWTSDHVAFLIGCSFSFEGALIRAGLPVSHITHGRNVAMYRTKLRLCDAGRFEDRYMVVSMRPYSAKDIEAIKAVTAPYELTHGQPIAYGWEGAEKLGIVDITKPEYGDSPVDADGQAFSENSKEIPVFWGCGVTPQNAVRGGPVKGTVLGHLPGHMLVLDIREEDVFRP